MRAAGLEPLEAYPNASAPWRCRCTVCDHTVTPTYDAVKRGHGCRECFRRRINPDEAVVVMIAAGLEPIERYPGAGVGWRCRCTACERTVTPSYSNVRRGQGGCTYCSGNKRVDTDEAVAVMVAAGLEPLDPYPGRDAAWRCRCTVCERVVAPTAGSVRVSKSGCAYCARNRVDADEAVAVMLAAGLEPLEPYPGGHVGWHVRCTTCESEGRPHYSSVRAGQGGCSFCAGNNPRDPGEATAVMLAAGLEPLEPYPGVNAPWRVRCLTCGTEGAPRLVAVNRRGHQCWTCAHRKGGLSRRLDEDIAAEVMVAAALEPLEPYPGGAGLPWRCRCTICERVVTPRYSDVARGQGGCKYCTPRGLDYTAPGIVYLMHHPDLFCLKVGVSTTAAKQIRVDAHGKTGWVIIRTWDTPTGDDAERIEQQVLAWWRNELGAPAALTKAEMPKGGWSETAALIHVDVDDTILRINWLVSQLDGE